MSLDSAGSIAIVGAGPSGALLATLLAQSGHDVVIYESRPDMRRVNATAGRSINLALATRGIVALERVGVMDRIRPITIPMRGRMVHADGQVSLQLYGNRENEVIHSVSRRDLNAILLDAAESTGRVRIEFEMRCRDVDLESKHISLTDGTKADASRTESFGTLFGTDGANSVIRDAVVAANGGTADVAPLGHGYKEFELPEGADGSYQLDPNALHIWPRGEFMLIALANPEGTFTVTLFAPSCSVAESRIDSFDSLLEAADVEQFFSREFPDFAPLVPDVVEQFFANPTGRLATVRTTGWAYGADAVLVGDAAHAIVPFHGQGMNAAMESCLVLERCLRESPDDVAEAFGTFEASRRPDTDAIADMALDNYVEMRSGVVDPRYQLRRDLALELERRWPEFVRPRYAMVMFSTIPYAWAQRRSRLQQAVFTELTANVDSIEKVDFARAERLVRQLAPFPSTIDSGEELACP